MIYYLHYLQEFGDGFKVFNLFNYITVRAVGACIFAFVISLLCGDWLIRRLVALKMGQPIRGGAVHQELHELHGGKAGTPTMGGLLLIGSSVLATVLFAKPTNPFIHAVLFVGLGLGLLGFFDDYAKVVKKSSDGISAKMKLGGQLVVALIAGIYLITNDDCGEFIRSFYVPFYKNAVITDMGFFSLVFFAIVILGSSNAVNLTDGLDGLATGCTITVASAYAIFSYVIGHATAADYLLIPHSRFAGELTIFCTALVGAGLGFMWFNCHPARVFMGDTGSLALGGMLATVAICLNQELVLVVVGGVFVMEALSVILQVGSFKLRGKRIFRMSPIHHHFELKGWHENQVIIRFWILSILCALLGLATLKIR